MHQAKCAQIEKLRVIALYIYRIPLSPFIFFLQTSIILTSSIQLVKSITSSLMNCKTSHLTRRQPFGYSSKLMLIFMQCFFYDIKANLSKKYPMQSLKTSSNSIIPAGASIPAQFAANIDWKYSIRRKLRKFLKQLMGDKMLLRCEEI